MVITIIMSIKNNLALIQEILNNLEQRDDKQLQTLHELGYLMGLMARIANDDSFMYSALKRELQRLRENSNK